MAGSSKNVERRAGQAPEPEPWRRAIVAAAIAISVFTLVHVPSWFLIQYASNDGSGWDTLAYVALMLIVLTGTPVVALVTTFTIGMAVDQRTRHLSTGRAAAWQAQVAMVPAIIATGFVIFSSGVAAWMPFLSLLVPAAVAGAVARLGVAKVLRSRGGVIALVLVTMVIASAPITLFIMVRSGA